MTISPTQGDVLLRAFAIRQLITRIVASDHGGALWRENDNRGYPLGNDTAERRDVPPKSGLMTRGRTIRLTVPLMPTGS